MIFMNYYLEEEPPQCSHLLDANNIRSRKMRALSDCDASISGGTSPCQCTDSVDEVD